MNDILGQRAEDTKNSHAKCGGDRGRGKEKHPHPKQHDPYKPDNKWFVWQNYTEKREQTNEGDGCYICGAPYGYEKFPEMKNLGVIPT